MERSVPEHILIVDDEEHICETLRGIIASWGMKPSVATDPGAVLNELKLNSCDVVLLDVNMPEISGLDLIPEIVRYCPDSKIIVMSGYAEKDMVIKALQLGAFDFLEKPFRADLLFHAVRRALEIQIAEKNRKQLLEDLKASHSELTAHKKRMEHLNRQLVETNKALSILAQNIALEREEVEKEVAFKLKSLVIPIIERMQYNKSLARYGNELSMLINQIIEDLTSGFSNDTKILSSLSFTELRIASLIKNGLTSDEIAQQLNIAPSTVRTHRKNIRKKLKINDSQYSLRNFLIAKSKNDTRK